MWIENFLNNRDQPRLVIFAGAGISAESGVPTFRDADGLWHGHDIDKVCNLKHFMENYELTHKFYNERRVALNNVKPNSAHQQCMDWLNKYGPDRVVIITTNVDDLFEQCAHDPSHKVMHVHGNLTHMIFSYRDQGENCVDIGKVSHDHKPFTFKNILTKPGVVFFNEAMRYEDGVKKPLYQDMDFVLKSLNYNDTAIVVGSSNTVVPFAEELSVTPAHTFNVNPKAGSSDHLFHENVYTSATLGLSSLEYSGVIAKRMDK